MKWRDLPPPDSFAFLAKNLSHYTDSYWHGIFENATYREVALDLSKGASLVTDLDFTAYYNDAGFTLLEAAVFTGLVSKANARRYQNLVNDYAALTPERSLDQKTRDEFDFYCATLRIFVGLNLGDLKNLAHEMWFVGIPGFREKYPLAGYIYPEMAYLFAVAAGAPGKTKDHGVVAVTASPDFAVAPALPLLSLTPRRLCSMNLAIAPTGLVTKEIPRPVHGTGKIAAAQEIFPDWDYACGDNPRNDLAFLAEARKRALGVGREIKILEGREKKLFCLDLAVPPVAA